jgi:hypothetical protein
MKGPRGPIFAFGWLVAMPMAGILLLSIMGFSRRAPAINSSAPFNAPTGTASPILFADDFESGNLSQWTSASNLVTQQREVHSGAFAVRGTNNGSLATYAIKTLADPQTDLYYSLWFKVLSNDSSTSVYLQRFRTIQNAAILGVFISNTGRLGYRNDVNAVINTSGPRVTYNVWHQLETHVLIADDASQVEIWLDGQPIESLSRTEALDSAPIGRLQLGDNKDADIYDVVFDEVEVSNIFIAHVEPQTPTAAIPPSPTTNADLSVSMTATSADEAIGTPATHTDFNGFLTGFSVPFLLGVLACVAVFIIVFYAGRGNKPRR